MLAYGAFPSPPGAVRRGHPGTHKVTLSPEKPRSGPNEDCSPTQNGASSTAPRHGTPGGAARPRTPQDARGSQSSIAFGRCQQKFCALVLEMASPEPPPAPRGALLQQLTLPARLLPPQMAARRSSRRGLSSSACS